MDILKFLQIALQRGIRLSVQAAAAENRYLVPHAAEIFGQLGGAHRANHVLGRKVVADDQYALFA